MSKELAQPDPTYFPQFDDWEVYRGAADGHIHLFSEQVDIDGNDGGPDIATIQVNPILSDSAMNVGELIAQAPAMFRILQKTLPYLAEQFDTLDLFQEAHKVLMFAAGPDGCWLANVENEFQRRRTQEAQALLRAAWAKGRDCCK